MINIFSWILVQQLYTFFEHIMQNQLISNKGDDYKIDNIYYFRNFRWKLRYVNCRFCWIVKVSSRYNKSISTSFHEIWLTDLSSSCKICIFIKKIKSFFLKCFYTIKFHSNQLSITELNEKLDGKLNIRENVNEASLSSNGSS